MITPLVLTGIGLRQPHFAALLEARPPVAWLEVHSENYFGDGGKALHNLEKIREHYPISLHGVGLSLGSSDELNWHHLKQLRDLSSRIEACLLSEHLSWSSIDGRYFHDLLPLPYTEEAISQVVNNIQQVQEYLQRQILIENISSYVTYDFSEMPESTFITEVAKRSGCGILLDVNNVYVNSVNLKYCPYDFIKNIPANLVQEIHLSGHSQSDLNGSHVLIDSHDQIISEEVWDLYRYAILYLDAKPTIIEWDTALPSLDYLCCEAQRAEIIIREVHATTKRAG